MACITCLLVGALNALVDPFGITRWIDAAGVNTYRPAMATRVRLAKAWDVRRIKPRAIALGTSRTHVSLSMGHSGWPEVPRHNLAFDGATTEEMFAYLQHAQAVAPLQVVVLGLDTWQLQGNPSSVRSDFDPSTLLEPKRPWSHVRARLAEARMLLSLDTASWSFKTLKAQSSPEPNWFALDGQRLGAVFFHRPSEEFMTEGPKAYFLQIDRREIGFKMPAPEPQPRQGQAEVPQTTVSSFVYIERMVRFCRKNGIALKIFITPAHAHQAEISYLMGELPAIEGGKRRLVQELADDARANSGDAFPLWDFSGFSSVTTEELPRSSTQEMAYYCDSSHFKSTVGDWVLDRMFKITRPNSPAPADFGRKLTPQSIEFEIRRDRGARLAYEASHPADVALLKSFIAAAARIP